MTYTIVYWVRNRKHTLRFGTLEAAKAHASQIFNQTGIIVGIETIKSK